MLPFENDDRNEYQQQTHGRATVPQATWTALRPLSPRPPWTSSPHPTQDA